MREVPGEEGPVDKEVFVAGQEPDAAGLKCSGSSVSCVTTKVGTRDCTR